MHIRFVAPRIHPNQHRIIEILEAEGVQVSYDVSKRSSSDFARYERFWPNCRISNSLVRRYSDTGDKSRSFPGLLAYRSYLKADTPDLLVIRNPTRVFSIIATIAGMCCRTKILFHSHTDLSSWPKSKRILVSYFMRMFKFAWMTQIYNIYESNSESSRFYHIPMVPRLREGCVDDSQAPPKRNHLTVLMVGKWRLVRKRHEWLLSAMADLNQQYDLRVVFVGERNKEGAPERKNKLRAEARRLNILDSVEFKENLSADQMKGLYLTADLFVLPASDEPAGVSVLEALACGVPVICSSTCGLKSYVRHGSNGFIFESSDYNDFVNCVREALTQLRSGADMSQNALNAHRAHFSDEVFLKRFRHLLAAAWGLRL